jgi:hypothetical protein
MIKSRLILSTIFVLLTPVIAFAQQERPPRPAQPVQPAQPVEEQDLIPPSKFEMFVDRTDMVIVASEFKIGRLTIRGVESGPEVTAHVAWVLDEGEKIYAAKIGEVFLDFEEIKTLEEGIGKILKAVSESYDKLGATSMSYKTISGISIDYFTFEASSEALRQNLRLVIGSFSTRSSTTAPLIELRTLLGQAREKLVSSGAK